MKLVLATISLVFLLTDCAYPQERATTVSLYSYTGYLTTPSAYIDEGSFGLHYTFLPNHAAPLAKGEADNWVFSGVLGLLPFAECYYSVFVSPGYQTLDCKTTPHYGSLKTRSPGIKLRILKERQWIPSVAVGVFDPDFSATDFEYSGAHTISSTVLVASKRFPRGSFSIGYGLKQPHTQWSRLDGVFGGIDFSLNDHTKVLADYDGEYVSVGINTRWKGFDVMLASVGSRGIAYRAGYTFDLLK